MFIYEYFFNSYYKPKYADTINSRTDSITKILGLGFGFA